MAYINSGYEKHADWQQLTPQPWSWGGYMSTMLNGVEMIVDIPPTLDSLTAKIVKWDFELIPPVVTGDGFIDFIGFFWCDEHERTHFADAYFPDSPRITQPDGTQIEDSNIPFTQIYSIASNSKFWANTFYWMWQGNEGKGRIGYAESPVDKPQGTHTWQLTPEDFDEAGNLKNRPIWGFYIRHLDWGNVIDEPAHPHIPGNAHWYIPLEYWFSDGIWNWKYHPWAIRKDGQWYSCNRSDAEVGHGDGHLAIRKGGRWNGIWNDDYNVNENEAYYDNKNGAQGPWTFCPRIGIGAATVRNKDQVHEWED